VFLPKLSSAGKQLKTNNVANGFNNIASVVLHIFNLNQINNYAG